MADTPKLVMPELTAAQAQKEVTHNDALRILDALVQLTILDKDLGEPPGAPSDGDTYIVGGTPSSDSDWNGHEDEVAYRKSSAWIFMAPAEGWKAYVQDENKTYRYDGASAGWVVETVAAGSDSYDIGASKGGAPTASEVLVRIPFVRAVDFADEMAGSKGVAGTAATAQTDFAIKRNGSQFGTMRFAAAATTATFLTSGGAESFAIGDILTMVAPASPDATLADIGFLLKGTKA